jgi:hypothetical protein
MAYRKNPTDKSQSEMEAAANGEAGITVQVDGGQKVVTKAVGSAPYRTQHDSAEGGQRANAGVVIPCSDQPNTFPTPGKA